jgi:seryl-tRNA(Sec) selenium transferase
MNYKQRLDRLERWLEKEIGFPLESTNEEARIYRLICLRFAVDIMRRKRISGYDALEEAEMKVRMMQRDFSTAINEITDSELEIVIKTFPGDLSDLSDEELQAIINEHEMPSGKEPGSNKNHRD